MSAAYEILRMTSDAYGEVNDCSVIALAIGCGVDYETAHQALEKLGRKDGRGVNLLTIEAAASALGYDLEAMNHMNPILSLIHI